MICLFDINNDSKRFEIIDDFTKVKDRWYYVFNINKLFSVINEEKVTYKLLGFEAIEMAIQSAKKNPIGGNNTVLASGNQIQKMLEDKYLIWNIDQYY